jgi:hypothetical protein
VSLASDYLHQAVVAPLDSPGSWNKLLTALKTGLRILRPVRPANAALPCTGVASLPLPASVVGRLDNPRLLAVRALNHKVLVPLLAVVLTDNPNRDHAVSLGIFNEAVVAPVATALGDLALTRFH